MDNIIELRALADGDLPLYKSWLYAPHVALWYHDPQDWLAEAEQRHGAFRWLHHYIVEYGGRPVGFCQYYDCGESGEDWYGTVPVDDTYSIDYLIGDPACLRKGLGKAIIESLMQTVRQLGAKRMIVQPEPENKASCATLLTCGLRYDKENQLYRIDF